MIHHRNNVVINKIDDMQVAETLPGGHTINTNAAKATGQGVEIELTARLTKALTLVGGFGYTDIKFDSFSDAQGDYEGNKNPWAPEYTFNIGAQYRHEAGFFARVDLVGYGKMYFDKANNYSSDPYELVNAKIGYETDRFDIYFYGKNIFDKKYDTRRAYDGFLDFYSPPGEVGLQAILRF
ncbi:TonB-dependent receptor [uncultured Desulfobacter sp.]|uniref:TonB-dependent receptor n=1 Tax=uncultured Desulfobacter sp. TaxID=240139 RepID=UPI002AA7E8F6|nr:TonB-dependent receptor [uncultured Desulfobacter sp.]